jgi:hypothetical protein
MASKQKQKLSATSLRRSAHHKKTGKYERQFARTAANKARRKARNS